jgi:magnesium chelatase subunit D
VPEQPVAEGERLARLLAYAALEPGLRSVLCFDFDADELTAAAAALVQALEDVSGRDARSITLSATADEDGLWTRVSWTTDGGAAELRLWPGPLAPAGPGAPLVVVVVPDLTRMSLPVARAAVALMGADVAHVERPERRARWRPEATWIAGCPSDRVGQVSLHLLDRFALRTRRRPGWRLDPARLGDELAPPEPVIPDPFASVDVDAARAVHPRLRAAATDRVLALSAQGALGMRRELALARAAVAQARLAGASSVDAVHVDEAAEVLGVAAMDLPAPAPRAQPAPAPAEEPAQAAPRLGDAGVGAGAEVQAGDLTSADAAVLAGAPDVALAPAAVAADDDVAPYPEDGAPAQRERDPLRLPVPPRGAAGSAFGEIVGVQPARELRDIALFATLVEALKARPRRIAAGGDERLVIGPDDLRAYRRAPPTAAMLALVLDYTARGEWDWTPSLMPFLRWAYTERASACVVRVGGRDPASELRAERTLARNLLDPRVAADLARDGGRATPLAHGLGLALHTLRHALHHGRRGLLAAWLVVVTDGRGNVPLDASRAGETPSAVGARGVEDALTVATQIAALNRLRVAVVDPEPRQASDLPHALARALGGTVIARGTDADA